MAAGEQVRALQKKKSSFFKVENVFFGLPFKFNPSMVTTFLISRLLSNGVTVFTKLYASNKGALGVTETDTLGIDR